MGSFWWFIFFPLGLVIVLIVLLLLLFGILKLERVGYQEFRLRAEGDPVDYLLDGLRRRGFSAYREGGDVVVRTTLINLRIRLVDEKAGIVAWWAEIPAITVVLVLIGLFFGIVVAVIVGLIVYLKYSEINSAVKNLLLYAEDALSPKP